MSAPLALDRALELWQTGQRRAALGGLAERVRATPSDLDARMMLIGFYRELGAPDQAGRWAAALEGVADERELDRLARLLAASGVGRREAPRFLALPPGPLPPRLEALLAGPVERYRQREPDRGPQPDRRSTPAIVLTEAVVYAWGATVVLLLLCAALVWTVAGLDVLDVRLVARVAALVVGVLVGLSAVLSGVVQLHEGERRSAIVWFTAGAVIIAVVTVSGLHGSTLPWDR